MEIRDRFTGRRDGIIHHGVDQLHAQNPSVELGRSGRVTSDIRDVTQHRRLPRSLDSHGSRAVERLPLITNNGLGHSDSSSAVSYQPTLTGGNISVPCTIASALRPACAEAT